MNKKYVVKDSCGLIVRVFNSYKEASVFKINKPNWTIQVLPE